MNYLTTCAFSALLALCSTAPSEALSRAPQSAAEKSVTLTAAPACSLARSVAEQLGSLAPQLKPLPNDRSFGAAHGPQKLMVACAVSADEIYTYKRLFSTLGIDLLPLKGDEPPQKVVQELADRLKIPYQGGATANLPLTYLFTAQGPGGQKLRLTIQAARESAPPREAGSSAHAAKPAAAAKADPPAVPARKAVATSAVTTLTAPVAFKAFSQPARGAGRGSESLFDLYLEAKANDPDLGRSQSRLLMSQADTDVVRAGFHPRLNADFGLSWINQSTFNLGPTQNSAVFGYNYDLIASMPLLHYSSYFGLAASAAAERDASAAVTASRQNLIFKLGQAYFSVLKARGDTQIAREEITRVKQAQDQAQAFLKAGTGDIIAVYEAQARLDSVLADQIRTESTQTLAEQKLSSIVGRVVTTIADELPKHPQPPEPNDLEWWLATMEARDPQIRQAQEGVNGSEQQTKAAKSDHLPVIDANGGFDVSKGAAFSPTAETHQWHVGATITLPLYTGGETSARVRRAYASEAERRYALDQVREQRRENLKQAFFNLRYNVSQIRALEQREASSLVQLNSVKKGRSIGTRTAIDLLNAEDAYSVAQRDLKSALYDNVVRIIELKAAAGVLSEDDIIPSAVHP